jgi:glucosylglycerate synthase
VTPPSLLSDELLQQLIAVGQVDILVGVPTLDNARTVGGVVRAVHASFATHFRRERTVLISSDLGSRDGTPDIVREASLREDETVVTAAALRTIHRISFPYHGLPAKGGAVHTLFAAADLLQARAVALFDADVTTIEPQWVERLVRPALAGEADFVAPVFSRHPADGPLITQLLRPMVRAAYGPELREPLASEFACSGRFVSHCLAQPAWEGPLARYGIDLWLTLEALAGGFPTVQVPLGPRLVEGGAPRPSLPETFGQVVGSLFDCLQMHEAYWTARTAAPPVPLLGRAAPRDELPPPPDPAPMVESFRSGVRDLAPLLGQILTPDTLRDVEAAAEGDTVQFSDALWTASVVEAAGAYRHEAMHREHLVRALVPVYLGRAASFLIESADRSAAEVESRLEELGRVFEDARPELIRTWTSKP